MSVPDDQERQRHHERALAEMEGRRKAAAIMAQHHRDRELFAASAFRDLSQETLKTSFAINVGIVVAILGFVGAVAKVTGTVDLSDFDRSLGFFASGAVVSAISMFVTLANYRANFYDGYDKTVHFNKVIWSPDDATWNDGEVPKSSKSLDRWIRWTRRLAQAGWMLSMTIFAVGVLVLYLEMHDLVGQSSTDALGTPPPGG